MIKTYADADFLPALLKPRDWLKTDAASIFKKYKDIWTSETAILEVLFYTHKYKLDPIKYIASLLALVNVKNAKPEIFIQAAYYMKHNKVNPADSIHASYCKLEGTPIVSSDEIFDKIGIERIRLGD